MTGASSRHECGFRLANPSTGFHANDLNRSDGPDRQMITLRTLVNLDCVLSIRFVFLMHYRIPRHCDVHEWKWQSTERRSGVYMLTFDMHQFALREHGVLTSVSV